jgi:hypothetical protein
MPPPFHHDLLHFFASTERGIRIEPSPAVCGNGKTTGLAFNKPCNLEADISVGRKEGGVVEVGVGVPECERVRIWE